MADITLKCDRCGKTVAVSEFANYDTLFCRHCGSHLGRPLPPSSGSERTYTLKPPMAQHPEGSPLPVSGETPPTVRRPSMKRRRLRFSHVTASWLLFAVLGGGLAWVRYGGGPAPQWLRDGLRPPMGPLIIFGFHLLIILRAFKESFFSGILCLLIPFYSFYYLFLVTDAFYLRALCAAWLVGAGHDAAVFCQEWCLRGVRAAQDFIASGGGEIR